MMGICNHGVNGQSGPDELSGGGRFALLRKNFVPAYVRVFEGEILQEVEESQISQQIQLRFLWLRHAFGRSSPFGGLHICTTRIF